VEEPTGEEEHAAGDGFVEDGLEGAAVMLGDGGGLHETHFARVTEDEVAAVLRRLEVIHAAEEGARVIVDHVVGLLGIDDAPTIDGVELKALEFPALVGADLGGVLFQTFQPTPDSFFESMGLDSKRVCVEIC